MIKQYIFVIVFNIPFLIFGQNQNNECKIPLTDLDLKMNVSTFFADKILTEDKNQYTTEYGTALDAAAALKKYGKTYIASKTNLTEEDLQKEFYMEGDDKTKIAQLYSVNRYTEDDKLVCYQNIAFPSFKILATNDDQFIALLAENRKVDEEEFKTLIGNLEKTNKLTMTQSDRFETYSFDLRTYSLQFKQAKQSYRSESSIQTPGNNPEKITKKIDLELVILSKKANDKHLNWLNKNH